MDPGARDSVVDPNGHIRILHQRSCVADRAAKNNLAKSVFVKVFVSGQTQIV